MNMDALQQISKLRLYRYTKELPRDYFFLGSPLLVLFESFQVYSRIASMLRFVLVFMHCAPACRQNFALV
jgi:hypothetical protein